MITKLPIEWNVYYYNSNSRKVETHNVFNHWRFIEYSAKHIKKYKDDLKALEEQIRRELMYYYWSKYEWEVLISPFSEHKDGEIKVDVYEQVIMNWDRFFEYFVAHKNDILRLAKEQSKR